MDLVKMEATSRTERGKGAARKLRAGGNIPGVVYGEKHESVAVTVLRDELERVVKSGANTLIELRVDGQEPPSGVAAIIKDLPRHPFGAPLAVDFQWVALTHAIEVAVPVVLEGVPEGVRLEGGVLEQMMHEIHVKCLPTAIPDRFTVDVSALNIGDSVHVSVLEIPEDVELVSNATDPVASVSAPRIIEEEEPEAEAGEELAGELEEGAEGEGAEEEE